MFPREKEHSLTRRFVGAALVVLVAAGCGGGEEGAETAESADSLTMDTAAAAPSAPAMSDAEIAAILAASDTAEIQPSELAGQKAQSAGVKEFAQRMVTDHGMLSDSLRAMAQQQGITPAPNSVSQQIQSQTQTTLQRLQGLSGAAFDSAYVQAMADSHQMALTTIDSQLLPAAQNPQLRASLEQKVRPAVAMHLEQIQQIQGSLGGR
jgi:putative membrane protein